MCGAPATLSFCCHGRLSRLEGLDEVEELDMLLKHYFIVRVRRRRSP